MSTGTRVEKYDTETGEVYYSVEKMNTRWIDKDGYLYVNRKCTQLLGKEILPRDVGNEAIVAFYYFITLLLGYDNVLLVKEDRDVRYATLDDMASAVGCSKRQIYRKVKPLLDIKAMVKAKNGNGDEYFVINPVYALYGKRISFRTYADFKDELQSYLNVNTVLHMDAAVQRLENGGEYEL